MTAILSLVTRGPGLTPSVKPWRGLGKFLYDDTYDTFKEYIRIEERYMIHSVIYTPVYNRVRVPRKVSSGKSVTPTLVR